MCVKKSLLHRYQIGPNKLAETYTEQTTLEEKFKKLKKPIDICECHCQQSLLFVCIVA